MRGTRKRHTRLLSLIGLLAALALVATACGEDEAADDVADDGDDVTDTTDDDGADDGDGDDDDGAAADGGEIEMGWIPWDENIANTFLWKEILEQEGYEVTETQLDVAPVFSGIADGSLDIFLDAWFPITHADYRDEFGDQFEELGVWYEPGVLTWAVPEYSQFQSIEDLANEDAANTLGSEIVGIEPGAGLTRISREDVVPGYGLDEFGYEVLESSTPAMLSELDRAIQDEEEIVVTLWHPHWAYTEYDIRDLEDPEQLLGEEEELYAISRDGFSEEFPDVSEWLSNFEMTDEQLGSLSLLIEEHGEGNEQDAAREWIEENREVVDGWLGR